MAHQARAVLSILNGASKSNSVQDHFGGLGTAGKVALDNAATISIKAPAALTGVCTVQVAQTCPSADADFQNYQDTSGVDVTIAAGKTVRIGLPGCSDLRIISAGAEGAQRDFICSIQEEMAG
jgi:hypothetical protein